MPLILQLPGKETNAAAKWSTCGHVLNPTPMLWKMKVDVSLVTYRALVVPGCLLQGAV